MDCVDEIDDTLVLEQVAEEEDAEGSGGRAGGEIGRGVDAIGNVADLVAGVNGSGAVFAEPNGPCAATVSETSEGGAETRGCEELDEISGVVVDENLGEERAAESEENEVSEEWNPCATAGGVIENSGPVPQPAEPSPTDEREQSERLRKRESADAGEGFAGADLDDHFFQRAEVRIEERFGGDGLPVHGWGDDTDQHDLGGVRGWHGEGEEN